MNTPRIAPVAPAAASPTTTRPARVELHIRRLALPAGVQADANHLAGLIQQRLQVALDPGRDAGESSPRNIAPSLDALLSALEPQVLAALRTHGFHTGESS